VIYTPEGRQARRATITPLTLPDAAAERLDLRGPQHSIEMAVHPEQVITLPAKVGASASDSGDDGAREIELDDDDENPFGQI
jgi:hypothetical protein